MCVDVCVMVVVCVHVYNMYMTPCLCTHNYTHTHIYTHAHIHTRTYTHNMKGVAKDLSLRCVGFLCHGVHQSPDVCRDPLLEDCSGCVRAVGRLRSPGEGNVSCWIGGGGRRSFMMIF